MVSLTSGTRPTNGLYVRKLAVCGMSGVPSVRLASSTRGTLHMATLDDSCHANGQVESPPDKPIELVDENH
eukprot:12890892-Prorocentrum_lima.AAC.1